MASFQPFDPCEVPITGANLVEASAGTGKTYAITTLVVRLLLERDLTIDQVLIVTFTEAATAELRGRVRDRLGDAVSALDDLDAGREVEDPVLRTILGRIEDHPDARQRLEAAIHNADLAAVFTIHGFCHRVLHDAAFESGVPFDTEILIDAHPLRDQVVGDFWSRELAVLPAAVVGRLFDSGLTLESCQHLVEKALRYPEAPLLPEDDVACDEPPLAAFEEAFDACVASWDEAAVRKCFSEPQMMRNRYREDWVDGWIAKMVEYLEFRPQFPYLIEQHVKFCPEGLEAGTKKGKEPPEHEFFAACERLDEAFCAFDHAARDLVVGLRHRLVRYARSELARRKETAGVMTFDDLLQHLCAALRGSHGRRLAASVRQRYPVALIDEFQDTDPTQFEIFGRIYEHPDATWFTVGDPKQAIYSFRGADVYAYMAAAEATPDDRRFTMGVNWRSDPGLVEAVNCLYARAKRPFWVNDIEYPPVAARPGASDELVLPEPWDPAPLDIVFVARGEHQRQLDGVWIKREYPDYVAAEVSRLLHSGGEIGGRTIQPSDCAVLTRTNYESFAIQDALRRLRIPSVVLGDESVFESAEAEELQRVLATVVEPTNGVALRAALTTELLGVTANDVEAMERDEEEWEAWVHDFREWNDVWATKGFVQMFRALMARRGVQARLLSLADGERRMTNVLHLMELLHTAARAQHLGPAGLLHWLSEQRANARARPEAAQIRLESDERAVRITTVHRSKGLEYGVVFCPYLWSGMLVHPDDEKVLAFHDPQDSRRMLLEVVDGKVSENPNYVQLEEEKLAENLRLLYVALTRAKHRCVVFWGAPYRHQQSALGYLLHPRDVAGFGLASLRAYLGEMSDDQMVSELESLAASSEGRIAVRVADVDDRGERWSETAGVAGPLRCRVPERPVDRSWRIASFTGLTIASEAPLADGREVDEVAAEVAGADRGGEPVPLAEFPRGARAGNFFHDVLEHLDFGASETHAEAVRVRLATHGYPAEWAGIATEGLQEVLAAPLGESVAGLCLADLPGDRRLNELEFHMPVASGGETRFSTHALAEPFEAHPSDTLPADYGASLRRLRFAPLEGFLKGYIDLAFEHDGRWYVADYKTNHLGGTFADYDAAGMREAMSHGHYYLQYHLYAVALHRWLGRRVPGYDYDQHFGGALYLFLRGMSPSAPGAGVFFERPPRQRIEALSEALERPLAVGGAR